jgi:hypothetical protein
VGIERSGRIDRLAPRTSWVVAGALSLILLVALALAAALWVLDHASGEHQVDALVPAGFVFLVWLLVPAGFVVGCLAAARPGSSKAPLVLPVLALTVAVAVTAWVVRPQAPDGHRYAENVTQGTERLRSDMARILDRVLPGQWSGGGIDDAADGEACLDVFGRSRGAGSGGLTFALPAEPSRNSVDQIAAAMRREGWTATVASESLAGGPGLDLEAKRNGYRVSASVPLFHDSRNGPVWVDATTPCLRQP